MNIRVGPDRGGAGILGFLRPLVVIPHLLVESFDDEELDHILLHEACHLKRCDPWQLAFGRLLQAIHWFNPVIHWAQGRARADRELACDERALAILPRCQHRPYGLTLLKVLRQSGAKPIHSPALSLGLAQRPSELERRISMIAEFRPSTRLRLALAALVTLVLAGVGLTDVAGSEPSSPSPLGRTHMSGHVILIPTEEGVQILVDRDRQ